MEQQTLTAAPMAASGGVSPNAGVPNAVAVGTAAPSWQVFLPPDLQVHPKIQAMSLEELARAYLAGPQGHVCDATTPLDYQFEKPFGADWYDEDMGEAMKQLMFAVGLSRDQARALHDAFIMLAQQAMADDDADAELEAQMVNDEILRIWGPRFEQKQEAARAAARFIGLTQDELELLAEQVDSLRLLDTLARIGEVLDEDSFAAGQIGGDITPEQAKSELARLSADKQHLAAFMNPAHPEHAKAKGLRSQLAQIAALASGALPGFDAQGSVGFGRGQALPVALVTGG